VKGYRGPMDSGKWPAHSARRGLHWAPARAREKGNPANIGWGTDLSLVPREVLTALNPSSLLLKVRGGGVTEIDSRRVCLRTFDPHILFVPRYCPTPSRRDERGNAHRRFDLSSRLLPVIPGRIRPGPPGRHPRERPLPAQAGGVGGTSWKRRAPEVLPELPSSGEEGPMSPRSDGVSPPDLPTHGSRRPGDRSAHRLPRGASEPFGERAGDGGVLKGICGCCSDDDEDEINEYIVTMYISR
jgi:hypothetical protein